MSRMPAPPRVPPGAPSVPPRVPRVSARVPPGVAGRGSVRLVSDRFVFVHDPQPGALIELAPGSHLGLRFRRGLGASRWHIASSPKHLLPLMQEGHELCFLVFEGDRGTLRLERRHPDRGLVHEVRELRVVALTAADARTSRSA